MSRVVYTCPFVPAEWIRAHGLQPSRVMPGPVPVQAGPGAGVCPYAWAFLQDVLADRSAEGVIFTTRCDQMRRLAETASRHGDVPAFLLNVPATWQTPSPRALYESELRRLGRFLVGLGGAAPCEAELEAAAHACEARRKALRASRTRLRPLRYWPAMADLACSGVCELDVPARQDADGGVRLALVGGPLMHHEAALFDLVEGLGATIALDATVSGELGLPAPIDARTLAADPFGAIVDAYWQIPDISRRPNDGFYRWLADRLAERGVQGIVFRHYTWCDTWHAEAHRLKEWSPVPVVVTVAGAEEQLDRHSASRVEALIEMLR